MNDTFTFEVYQNRRRTVDTYRFKLTETGWYISHLAINGETDPSGKHILYANFNQDYINFPNSIGDYLEWLWGKASSGVISREETQIKLQELADWVSTTEKSRPMWKEWNC